MKPQWPKFRSAKTLRSGCRRGRDLTGRDTMVAVAECQSRGGGRCAIEDAVTRLDVEIADYEAAVAKVRSAKRSVAVPSRP